MSALLKVLKITLAITVVALLIGAHQPVSAQAVVTTDSDALPPAVATSHVLEHTYINSGDWSGATFPAATFNPIDTQLTVVCPVGPCSIAADMLVQNGKGSHTDNFIKLCLYVDGVAAPNCDYIAGLTPSGGGEYAYTNAMSDDIVSGLATGHHTVQMYFYSAYGCVPGHYQATYRVYEP